MTRLHLLPTILALAACLLAADRAAAQSTYTWTGPGSDWLNPGPWTGGPAGTWPGVTTSVNAANGSPYDLAVIGATLPGSSKLGIDMSAAGGTLAVGGLWLDTSATGSEIWVGNSS